MLCGLVWAVAPARVHNFYRTVRQGWELDTAAYDLAAGRLGAELEVDKSGSHADAFSDCGSRAPVAAVLYVLL